MRVSGEECQYENGEGSHRAEDGPSVRLGRVPVYFIRKGGMDVMFSLGLGLVGLRY